jgi:hypothetical protein
MTMAVAGELLASLYGVAVLVMRALPSGHVTGQLFMRGAAGEACVCVWWRDVRATGVYVELCWMCCGTAGVGYQVVVEIFVMWVC